ncbi:MAG: tRNA pseudouridine synthase [Actinomycetota bacterium]
MARRRPPTVHGLAVVDKPRGVTSHDVVGQLRRRLGERQVGHAGTLDPDATGVLLVGVGRATRVLRFLTDLGKTYRGEVRFGSTTDSLDSTGQVTGTFEMPELTLETVRAAIADHLTGAIEQIPPMVSAVRVDGRRLHELAREGVEVERAPRPVTVYRFDAEPTADPLVYTIEVHCSKGTYIRTLADDLGRLCGGGAHLHGLRRIAVGGFTVEAAASPDEVVLLPLTEAVRDYPQVEVDAETAALVRHGRVLDSEGTARFVGDGPWAVVSGGELLAMYERFGARQVKPAVVISTDD